MLYWRYSANRILFLNEYWLLVPTTVLANYFIIRGIRSHKAKTKELEKFKNQIERERRIRRIMYLALGLDGLSRFLIRGGADPIQFVDSSNVKCGIEEGVRFLDNDRLRKIIHDLYRRKRRNKIIYITASAACHLCRHYGKYFLAIPVAVGDFGTTNLYHTTRKIIVVSLLGGVVPLFALGTSLALSGALGLMAFGLRLAFADLDFIPTSPILADEFKNLKPRIPDIPDVVVVNVKPRDKIVMTNPLQDDGQCWLPDQAVFNSACKPKPVPISDELDFIPDLRYEDVVNMKDVTKLDYVDFSDTTELGQFKPNIPHPRKGKTVNFLEKFGDSRIVDETDTWEVDDVKVTRGYLRGTKER